MVDDVVSEQQALGDPAALAPGAAVNVVLPPGLPRLHWDPVRMRLMMRYLLGNALRHNAGCARPVQLSVSLQADGAVLLVVRDHGPGVPEANAHLQPAYAALDGSRKRHRAVTGASPTGQPAGSVSDSYLKVTTNGLFSSRALAPVR